MAITFNGTTINSVKFNNANVDKVIFNGVTVFQSQPQTLLIGTSHSSNSNGIVLCNRYGGSNTSALYTGTNASTETSYTFDGFNISIEKTAHTYEYSLLRVFDGESGGGYAESGTGKNSTLTTYIVFPFAVELTNITVYNLGYIASLSGKKDFSTYSVGSSTSSSATSFNSVGSGISAGSTLTASNNKTGIRKLQIITSGYSTASYGKRTLGEIKMTVNVNHADYQTWKTTYGLTGNTNIP